MATQSNTINAHYEISEDQLEEVRRRRMLAFLVDYCVIALLVVVASVVVAIAGVITFGAAWLLYAILVPLVALVYIASTMGGAKNATLGMQLFSIRVETLDGKPFDGLMAVVHSVLFWAIHIAFTPLMLFASLFSSKKRLLHDFLLGTVFVRSDVRV